MEGWQGAVGVPGGPRPSANLQIPSRVHMVFFALFPLPAQDTFYNVSFWTQPELKRMYL